MKHMKKLIAVMLTFVMAFAMAATVFAETTTYTLTIDNAKSGHVYGAYQVFSGKLAGNVLTDVEWGEGVDKDKILTKLNEGKSDNEKYKSAADVAKALEEGKALQAADFTDIVANCLTTDTDKMKTSGSYDEDNKQYTITELKAGYYFVKDKDTVPSGDAYTKYVLKIVKDTEMTPKSDVPETEKKVNENEKDVEAGKTGAYGEKYNDVADYNIGDTVPYAFYSKVPDMTNYKSFKYVFEDTMSEGLTFNNDVTVTIGGQEVPLSKYTVTKKATESEAGLTDGCTFHVEISDLKALATELGVSKDAEIRVDFTATLNQGAKIGLDGNPNTMKLKFSNNPNDNNSMGETPDDKVIVFTYELDVTKKAGESDTKLQGAEFVLYKEVKTKNESGEESTKKSYVRVDANKKVTGWTDNKSEASTLTSDTDGLFKVIGLDDGTYYLEETKAPDSYNLLKNPVTLEIKATTINNQNWTGERASDALTALKIKVDNVEADGNTTTGIVEATVENNKGATLPETGGMGTTIFYIIGAILIIGSGVLMITRRRMSKN